MAYGKFFDKKTGFISLEWLPYFANYRSDGHDFDSAWEESKANCREKLIMDVLTDKDGDGHIIWTDKQILSTELKHQDHSRGASCLLRRKWHWIWQIQQWNLM